MRTPTSHIVPLRRTARHRSRPNAAAAAAAVTLAALACLLPMQASARTQPKAAAKAPSVLDDFAGLSTMRPRSCPDAGAAGFAAPGWQAAPPQCAWQGLLSLRTWRHAAADAPDACTGSAAQWWAWIRRAYRADAAPAQAWQEGWDAQVLAGQDQGVQRLALIVRAGDGWTVSEWRWRPSARAATRRWQEGRWKLLLDAAARYRRAAAPAPDRWTEALRQTWERNLGERAGERRAGAWRWQSGGYCLTAEAAGVGQAELRLPYRAEDSRLEQRSAMQLQLARRHPTATWLRPFHLVGEHEQGGPSAPAKYQAIWQLGDRLNGQLWIPTANEGPVLRLRAATPLAAGRAAPDQAAAAAAQLERELDGLARRWDARHE